MACEKYFEAVINSGLSSFTVAGLTPSTDFKWSIEDKFGKVYNGTGTSTSNGNLVINIASPLLRDMFREFSGDFKFKIANTNGDSIKFWDEYDYILLQVKQFIPQLTDPVKISQ